MTGKLFWTTAEVADAIGLSLWQFRVRRGDLIDNHGFPQAMPYYGTRGDLWRREAVEAWRDQQGLPKGNALPADVGSGNVVQLLREARSA